MGNDYKNVKREMQEEAKQLMSAKQLKKCHTTIHIGAAASFAGGVLPIPVADTIPITAAQLTMVGRLAWIFGMNISETAAKGIISTAAATMIGRNIAKMAVPVIGWGISGVVAAGVTEAIGWSIAVDFAKQARNNTTNQKSVETSEKELNENQQMIDTLLDRANPFLSGEKSRYTDKDEYNMLINDFEKILDLIPENDPLRDIYDKLCLIF